MNLPNKLTTFRVILIPFFVFFNFEQGTKIGNFAEVYPHFLSLLFLKSHSDFTGI